MESLASQGQISAARDAATALLQQCQVAVEKAYAGADYDLALAYLAAGRFTHGAGNATEAIPLLKESRSRFQQLATNGNQGARQMSARQMAAAALNVLGDCQLNLELLDEAAQSYQQSTQKSEQAGNPREVAVSRMQLGTLRLRQKRCPEALQAYKQAMETFTQLQEPLSVAVIWHQTGMVYHQMESWDLAESAYQKSLEIRTNQDDLPGMAGSLNQLGSLYQNQNRLEDAVVQYRNAAATFVQLGNLASEGKVCNNLASALLKLNRLAEARQEIQRAMECERDFGHAAEPWITWQILADIEAAAGQPQAADQARRQARQLYAQFRRDGGENNDSAAQWCQGTAMAIQQGRVAQEQAELEKTAQNPEQPPEGKALAQVLLAILDGQRQPELADTEGLTYDSAVEVERLLEYLAISVNI